MSSVQSVDAKCGKCGTAFKQTIYPSVNVALDPSLKQRVLSADIFKVTCPSCGHVTHTQYDCIYHDMQKALMISVTSADGLALKKEAMEKGMASLSHLNVFLLESKPSTGLLVGQSMLRLGSGIASGIVGGLDDVAIYSRELSVERVAAHHALGRANR